MRKLIKFFVLDYEAITVLPTPHIDKGGFPLPIDPNQNGRGSTLRWYRIDLNGSQTIQSVDRTCFDHRRTK